MGQSDRKLMSSIGLVLVDEIHNLNDSTRGATLEGLLSRLLVRQEEASRDIPDPSKRDPVGNQRILALSATAPNATDVASWLRGTSFTYDDTFRPVPISYHVYDYRGSSNYFAFDNLLNSRLLEIIRRHADNRPALVFNATQKGSFAAAKAISDSLEKMGLVDTFVTSERQKRV